ncbi:MAG TPA: 50S ribosomal protein L15 [Candidatus Paceibacterota bacterium]|nr:50S ribosomal protein L15 [Candidatus Paceibacterota bacterium]
MLHTLKSHTKNKKPKLVGRGGKRGKTAGRGTKGQKARAGHKIRPHIRDVIKKLPKLRGRGKNINKAFQLKPAVVNLSVLEALFETGAMIRPQVLLERGLIKRQQGTIPAVKILATGELTKKLSFFDCSVSAAAKAKIEAVGGTVK